MRYLCGVRIATETYRIEPSTYARVVLGRWLSRYWWIGAVPVALAVGFSFWQIEFLIVALILAMLVYPFAVFTVYMNYALTDRARASLLPHVTILDNDKIVEKWDVVDDVPTMLPNVFSLEVNRLNGISQTKNQIILAYGRGVADILIIPVTSFANGASGAECFVNAVYESYRRNCVNLPS